MSLESVMFACRLIVSAVLCRLDQSRQSLDQLQFSRDVKNGHSETCSLDQSGAAPQATRINLR